MIKKLKYDCYKTYFSENSALSKKEVTDSGGGGGICQQKSEDTLQRLKDTFQKLNKVLKLRKLPFL